MVLCQHQGTPSLVNPGLVKANTPIKFKHGASLLRHHDVVLRTANLTGNTLQNLRPPH